VIAAVAATVAPFAGGEKPQLFPWNDASLIKNSRRISELHLYSAACCTARSSRGVTAGMTVMPIFIGFLRYCGAAQADAPVTRTGT
jgi:hypothetical protein